MKHRTTSAIAAAVLLLLIFTIVGCPQRQDVMVPAVPAWAGGEVLGPAEVYAIVSERDSAMAIRSDAGAWVKVDPDHARAIIRWHLDTIHALRVPNTEQSWTCSERAKHLVLAFSKSASRAGVRAQPLVSLVVVTQERAWGGIPAGDLHAVVWIETTKGPWVVEPANGHIGDWDRYPNPRFEARIGGEDDA